MKKIVIIDYNIGNVKSLSNALIKIGLDPLLTREASEILTADYVILPGVGAFSKCMENLQKFGLTKIIHTVIKKKTPFLGICVGMQLLMEQSEEFGITKGLGVIKGSVKKLQPNTEKLPHISWNELTINKENMREKNLFSGVNPVGSFYFIHTYACQPVDSNNILSLTKYGKENFCSSIIQNNLIGVQFHPEKSGECGLAFLKNFSEF